MLHAATQPLSVSREPRAQDLHVVLVAGASGGGKSTFIRLLSERHLGRDILAALPEGAWRWPVLEVNNMLKKGLSLDAMLAGVGSAAGAILHYDIAYIHRFALGTYERDPASELFGQVGRLDTVLVKTDLDRLTRQHQERHQAQVSSKNRAELLWGAWVRQPLRQLHFRLQGHPAVDTQTLYQTPNFLSDCYTAWEAYVRNLVLSKPASRMLIVTPDQESDGSPAFRLMPAQP
jgi:hypothetical protein